MQAGTAQLIRSRLCGPKSLVSSSAVRTDQDVFERLPGEEVDASGGMCSGPREPTHKEAQSDVSSVRAAKSL